MPKQLSPSVAANMQRILDSEARRILAERTTLERPRPGGDGAEAKGESVGSLRT